MKRLPYIFAVTLISAFTLASVRAEPGDEILSAMLSKSELVVSGSISTNAVGIAGGGIGLVTYMFTFRIDDVIKGPQEMRGQTIRVYFDVREGTDELAPSTPLFKPNAKRIMFLNEPKSPNHGFWVQADRWFAIHISSNWMVDSLKRLEGEKAKN